LRILDFQKISATERKQANKEFPD